jgi:hypothetical protein
MQSSAIGDHTNWTTQGADGKTFEDGGPLIGGRDLRNGAAIIFQESAMRLVQFTGGGSALYSISKVADGRGAIADRSIVAFDGMVFWLATDGFYKYTAGGAPEPIGAEKFNRWFASQVSTSNYELVQGAVDPYNKVVWWRLNATTLLGYDWQLNEAITLPAATSTLSRIATAGISWGTVSGDWSASNSTVWGDRTLQGGQPVFGALDSSNKFATFSGSSSAARIRSSEIITPGSKRFHFATPISDATIGTLSIGVKDALTGSLSFSTPSVRNDNGEVPLDTRGNIFAFEETIPAGATWTYSNGVDNIASVADGQR